MLEKGNGQFGTHGFFPLETVAGVWSNICTTDFTVVPDPFLLFLWGNGSCPTVFTWEKSQWKYIEKKYNG